MAQRFTSSVHALAEKYVNKILPEAYFKASIDRLINPKGSESTKFRKRRTANLLYNIYSRVNQATFVLSVYSIRYTVGDCASDIDAVVEDLLRRSKTWDVDQISLRAAELCEMNAGVVSKLLSWGETAATKPLVPYAKNKHAQRPHNSELSPVPAEDCCDLSSTAQTHPEPIESQSDLISHTSREPRKGRSNSSSIVQRYPEPVKGLAGFSALTLPEVTEGYSAQMHHINVPLPHLLAVFAEFGNSTARCIINGTRITGFNIIRESETIATVQLSYDIADFIQWSLLNSSCPTG